MHVRLQVYAEGRLFKPELPLRTLLTILHCSLPMGPTITFLTFFAINEAPSPFDREAAVRGAT